MVNIFVVQGNLVNDPVVRQTNAGPVCNFRIANNAAKDRTIFLDVAVWGKRGESCAEHLYKGRSVLVHGALHQESWGDNKTSLVINANNIEFLGSPKDKKVDDTPIDSSNIDDNNAIPF